MVGVVGSSPIAPTKQNPLCWAVWKGSPKGGPFFVVWCLGKHWECFGQTTAALHLQVGFDLHINHRVIAVPCLVVFDHLHVSVTHQTLNVFLLDTLLLVQSCTERADLVEGGALTRRHFLVSLGIVLSLGERLGQIVCCYCVPVAWRPAGSSCRPLASSGSGAGRRLAISCTPAPSHVPLGAAVMASMIRSIRDMRIPRPPFIGRLVGGRGVACGAGSQCSGRSRSERSR